MMNKAAYFKNHISYQSAKAHVKACIAKYGPRYHNRKRSKPWVSVKGVRFVRMALVALESKVKHESTHVDLYGFPSIDFTILFRDTKGSIWANNSERLNVGYSIEHGDYYVEYISGILGFSGVSKRFATGKMAIDFIKTEKWVEMKNQGRMAGHAFWND